MSKDTKRDWHWSGTVRKPQSKQYLYCGNDVVVYDSGGVSSDYAEKIERALNEYDDLKAMAEAAEKIEGLLQITPHDGCNGKDSCNCIGCVNLRRIREVLYARKLSEESK